MSTNLDKNLILTLMQQLAAYIPKHFPYSVLDYELKICAYLPSTIKLISTDTTLPLTTFTVNLFKLPEDEQHKEDAIFSFKSNLETVQTFMDYIVNPIHSDYVATARCHKIILEDWVFYNSSQKPLYSGGIASLYYSFARYKGTPLDLVNLINNGHNYR